MKKNNVNELICRLMSGETTPEEERQLQQLLRSQSSLSSEEKAILQFLDAAFQGRPQAMREADAESILPSENADEKRIVKQKGWGLRQIAAAVLLLLCLSGISYAAIRWLGTHQKNQPIETTTQTEEMATMENHEKDSIVTYNNVRLDSILEDVGEHYHRTITVNDSTTAALRFYLKWNQNEPLSVFIETVEELEKVIVTERNDTLFVSSINAND
ncbi:MAG: DUF4974 domain-containing protein [Bacteroidaceae bacterium]|nr:DUF4974 domain-containing protein [Bacteroidaceae bacterium]